MTEQEKVLQLVARLQMPGGFPESASIPAEVRAEVDALVAKWQALPAGERAELVYAAWYGVADGKQKQHSPTPALHRAKRFAKTEAERREIAKLIHDELAVKAEAF